MIGCLIYPATGIRAEYYETIGQMRAYPSDTDGGLRVRFTGANHGDVVAVDYTGSVPDSSGRGLNVGGGQDRA